MWCYSYSLVHGTWYWVERSELGGARGVYNPVNKQQYQRECAGCVSKLAWQSKILLPISIGRYLGVLVRNKNMGLLAVPKDQSPYHRPQLKSAVKQQPWSGPAKSISTEQTFLISFHRAHWRIWSYPQSPANPFTSICFSPARVREPYSYSCSHAGDVCPAHQLILHIEDYLFQHRWSTIFTSSKFTSPQNTYVKYTVSFPRLLKKMVVKGVKNMFNLGWMFSSPAADTSSQRFIR